LLIFYFIILNVENRKNRTSLLFKDLLQLTKAIEIFRNDKRLLGLNAGTEYPKRRRSIADGPVVARNPSQRGAPFSVSLRIFLKSINLSGTRLEMFAFCRFEKARRSSSIAPCELQQLQTPGALHSQLRV
jgi:hypothetical protein